MLRAEGHVIHDTMLARTTAVIRKHLKPFGRYHFDLIACARQAAPTGSRPQREQL